MQQTERLWKMENRLIRKEFGKCNKIAFLLPHFKCEQMKRESRGLSKQLGNLHLGKETYLKGYNAFTVSGRVPSLI